MTEEAKTTSADGRKSAGGEELDGKVIDGLTGKVALDPGMGPHMPLPGIIAIALYMLVLGAVVTFGAIGKHLPMLMLVLAPFFIT